MKISILFSILFLSSGFFTNNFAQTSALDKTMEYMGIRLIETKGGFVSTEGKQKSYLELSIANTDDFDPIKHKFLASGCILRYFLTSSQMAKDKIDRYDFAYRTKNEKHIWDYEKNIVQSAARAVEIFEDIFEEFKVGSLNILTGNILESAKEKFDFEVLKNWFEIQKNEEDELESFQILGFNNGNEIDNLSVKWIQIYGIMKQKKSINPFKFVVSLHGDDYTIYSFVLN